MRATLVKRPEDLKVRLSREERELVDACLRQEAGKDVDMNLVVGQYIKSKLYAFSYDDIIVIDANKVIKIDPADYNNNKDVGHIEKNGYTSMMSTFKFKGFTVGVRYRIHEIIALQKYGPYSKMFVVNHIDCCRLNSTYTNIEVITQEENQLHATICNVILKKHGWSSLPVGVAYKDIPSRFKIGVYNRNKKQYKEDLVTWYECYRNK